MVLLIFPALALLALFAPGFCARIYPLENRQHPQTILGMRLTGFLALILSVAAARSWYLKGDAVPPPQAELTGGGMESPYAVAFAFVILHLVAGVVTIWFDRIAGERARSEPQYVRAIRLAIAILFAGVAWILLIVKLSR